MLHKKFILRQVTGSKKQSAVFVLCVMLSIVTIVALNGFSESISSSMLKDARALHAGDIILHSHFPFSKPLADAVQEIEKKGMAVSMKVYGFYSVVRVENEKSTLLADLKIVEPGYPFYGKIELGSGKNIDDILTTGNIIVEQTLMDRLKVKIGDRLHVGSTILTIADVVVKEPGRPVNFLSFGPRIFLCEKDLQAIDLLKKGSRIQYHMLLKVFNENDIDKLALSLKSSAIEDQERVNTYKDAGSRIKRFFDNLLFFLALIAIFTLLLAGFGINSALTAFLREKEMTIAAIKTIGGTGPMIIMNYLVVVFVLGLTGTLLGLCFGFMLQYLLPALFTGLLPQDMELIISWKAIAEGMILGLLVVILFTFLPLFRLKNIKPASVFRKDRIKSVNKLPAFLAWCAIFLFFAGTIFRHINDMKTGIYFILAITGLIIVTSLMTISFLLIIKRFKFNTLSFRQVVKGLFRPGNATKSIIITLSTSLSVIFSIYLIEKNLDKAFVLSFPPDAPNLFFIDIQPDQVEDFSKFFNSKPDFYPVIRSRLISIKGEKIDRTQERRRRGDNLSRAFNLTYRDYLLDDEKIVKGKNLFDPGIKGLQVSVLDTVVRMRHLDIGDPIEFNVQGLPVKAFVSSIRTRTKESVKPYFYFVFPADSMIKNAPQTIFSAVRTDKNKIAEIQSSVVSRFPNISVIDVTQTIAGFSSIMHRLSRVIRFFTFFSIIAGILIIISSVFATRFARIREAVFYKILGAEKKFILAVFTLENAVIGLVSGGIALLISQIGSIVICIRIFDITYDPFAGSSAGMIIASAVLVIIIGNLASVSILKQKPAAFLREQADG
ncbi:MacB-like periplasmic core domain-containing protein [Desulfonema limicola]|uniref:MacB-like periplasmic core domain-containing protein n=1 Tax=Desulfonema limicola TaxID=45656 RepID=A0A975B8Q7_9BACT|nr:FtsX-like permease family protein [Desulfonema limicola]QTA81016.1 MacB-like periplasmic core domain-containing protein [Desulfonema limicola]